MSRRMYVPRTGTIVASMVGVAAVLLFTASSASAAPTTAAGCTFDSGVTTCVDEEEVGLSVWVPYVRCESGQAEPVEAYASRQVTIARTVTTWQGLFVNDRQHQLSSESVVLTEVQYAALNLGPICPLVP